WMNWHATSPSPTGATASRIVPLRDGRDTRNRGKSECPQPPLAASRFATCA
ncbi:MAG: hypothetical protein AVDCRST_MAG91-2133, partial [uncultured Sphingomonadaceae bacterium]